jgi:hypothetical protein
MNPHAVMHTFASVLAHGIKAAAVCIVGFIENILEILFDSGALPDNKREWKIFFLIVFAITLIGGAAAFFTHLTFR